MSLPCLHLDSKSLKRMNIVLLIFLNPSQHNFKYTVVIQNVFDKNQRATESSSKEKYSEEDEPRYFFINRNKNYFSKERTTTSTQISIQLLCPNCMESYKDHLWMYFCGQRIFWELFSHPPQRSRSLLSVFPSVNGHHFCS